MEFLILPFFNKIKVKHLRLGKSSPESEDMLFFSVVDGHLCCAAEEVKGGLTFCRTISEFDRLAVVETDLPSFQHNINSYPGPISTNTSYSNISPGGKN